MPRFQIFSRPDAYIGFCGHLRCRIATRKIPEAPLFMCPIRAMFVTDTHLTARTSDDDCLSFVRQIARAKPDLLLLGGDYADECVHARRLFSAMKGLRPPLGIYAVMGNNDREAWPSPDRLAAAMHESGITLLINRAVNIPTGGGHLIIAGVDEYKNGIPDAEGLYPDVPSPDRYRLLISHYPVLPKVFPDLMLSGHTHGGQFNLMGITPYTVGFERLSSRKPALSYIAGIHRFGGMISLTGKGIGASRIPMRIGVCPQMDLMQFVQSEQC